MTSLLRRREVLTRNLLILVAGLLLTTQGHLHATNDENHIQEVMVGANGNSKIQFIVIRQESIGNCWGTQVNPAPPGFPLDNFCFLGTQETQSRVMLVFFDAAGRETGKFKFPHNPTGASPATVLIATQDFANLPGAPTPNFIIPPLLNPIAGKVCFTNNPLNPRAIPGEPTNAFARNDCLCYR